MSGFNDTCRQMFTKQTSVDTICLNSGVLDVYTAACILKLKAGCYDEYKRRHDELWPEMIELIARHELSTVVFRRGDLLFVYSGAPSKQAWDEAERDPLTSRWNEYMRDVLESGENGELDVEELPLVFACGTLLS